MQHSVLGTIPRDAYAGHDGLSTREKGNVGRSPGESGIVFWALHIRDATLWPLAKPLLQVGHTA